jgi:tetratricopeptide (TPR) repeat protein
VLASLTVFPEAPTVQQIAIATEWPIERIERALTELENVTLITRVTQPSDGRALHTALPITLSFARHQLDTMGDFEVRCRQRFQKYTDQMSLHESELHRFKSIFERYGLVTENEKRAAILCRRGESEMFIGNVTNADALFKQARDLVPKSAYVYAMSASYGLARNRVGEALDYVKEACKRCNKNTGALCYTIKARILDVQRDRHGRVAALQTALEYDSSDSIVRHQYGVALSRVGRTEEAIQEFTRIIDVEKTIVPIRETLLMAVKTRIINLRRLNRKDEADRDLAYAREVLANNPHLQSQVYHIAELDDE